MVPGCFSALWTWRSRRRSRGLGKDTAVPQVAAPAGATQTNHRDAHSYSVPTSGNVDAPDPAPSQDSVPSIATPQVGPTDVQIAIPRGPTIAGIAGTLTLGGPAFSSGQAQLGLFPGPQGNRVAEPADTTSPSSSPPDGSPQNPSFDPTQLWAQGLSSGSSSQGNTAPSTPGATSSTIIVSSPSAVNGTPSLNPIVQPTSPTPGFMPLVTPSLDEFDPHVGLFGPGESGIDFEQFREWFDPPEEKINGVRNG